MAMMKSMVASIGYVINARLFMHRCLNSGTRRASKKFLEIKMDNILASLKNKEHIIEGKNNDKQ